MAYAKINSITNANMAKVNNAAKAALGKIGSIDAPASGADAPVTSGLIGYWRGSEGITTDTSGGTTTVSQWDNIASDRGGEASQTWHMTQSTKAEQPTYDATNKLVNFAGGSTINRLVFDQTKVNYDTTYTVIILTDISAIGFGVHLGGNSVQGYLRTAASLQSPIYRHVGFTMWYPPYDSSDSDLTSNANFDIIGWSWAASPSDASGLGWITGRHLFLEDEDADPGNTTLYGSPSDKPLYVLGGYGDQTTNFIAQDIKEVMIFNKQVNQTEVTAIYNYMNGIVTLDGPPADLDYYGSA
jgi:hypothetical protein